MIRITVFNQPTRRLQGTAKQSGKPYDLTFQTIYAHTVDRDGNSPPVPEKVDIVLDKDQQPYPAGEYTLHPSAVYVDQNGRLACAPRLTPLKAPAKTA